MLKGSTFKFNGYGNEVIGIYWRDLHNMLPMTDSEATDYFKIFKDLNVLDHVGGFEERGAKFYLHYTLHCDEDFFTSLKRCFDLDVIRKILVDCDFSLLD